MKLHVIYKNISKTTLEETLSHTYSNTALKNTISTSYKKTYTIIAKNFKYQKESKYIRIYQIDSPAFLGLTLTPLFTGHL